MKKVTIIRIGYLKFAITSKADASRIVDLLSKVMPVDSTYSSDRGYCFYPSESVRDVSIEFNQDLYPTKAEAEREPVKAKVSRPMRSEVRALIDENNNILRLNG